MATSLETAAGRGEGDEDSLSGRERDANGNADDADAADDRGSVFLIRGHPLHLRHPRTYSGAFQN